MRGPVRCTKAVLTLLEVKALPKKLRESEWYPLLDTKPGFPDNVKYFYAAEYLTKKVSQDYC